MSKKKIFWILLLIVVIAVAVVGIVIARPTDNIAKDSNNNSNKLTSNNENKNGNEQTDKKESDSSTTNSNAQYQKIELSDGTLYSIDGKQVTADLVIGDNYYDTTISDMYLNPESYMGKNIEIEGMYLENSPYTFVGRYSASNLCAYCPPGYSYVEYMLDGTIDRRFVSEEDWIKVIGTLEVGNDETTDYNDYYYLKVLNLEVMNEKGNDTVNN